MRNIECQWIWKRNSGKLNQVPAHVANCLESKQITIESSRVTRYWLRDWDAFRGQCPQGNEPRFTWFTVCNNERLSWLECAEIGWNDYLGQSHASAGWTNSKMVRVPHWVYHDGRRFGQEKIDVSENESTAPFIRVRWLMARSPYAPSSQDQNCGPGN